MVLAKETSRPSRGFLLYHHSKFKFCVGRSLNPSTSSILAYFYLQRDPFSFRQYLRTISSYVFSLTKMLGVGGLITVPFAQRFGRLPVLWWSTFLGLLMTLFATLAPNTISFIVARCLQGFFTTAPQCIGVSFIHDMYYKLDVVLIIGSSSTNARGKLGSGRRQSLYPRT